VKFSKEFWNLLLRRQHFGGGELPPPVKDGGILAALGPGGVQCAIGDCEWYMESWSGQELAERFQDHKLKCH
jgi:hypothetical protein